MRVRGKDLQRIVTAEAAAAAVGSPQPSVLGNDAGISYPPSTAAVPLYRVADVLAAARRSPPGPQRLYRGLR